MSQIVGILVAITSLFVLIHRPRVQTQKIDRRGR